MNLIQSAKSPNSKSSKGAPNVSTMRHQRGHRCTIATATTTTTTMALISQTILNLLILHTLISLMHPLTVSEIASSVKPTTMYRAATFSLLPKIIFADALECETDMDCDINGEKICHENKCICGRERPVEAGGSCLNLQSIDEPCQVDSQCLSNSNCIEGICSCGNDAIRLWNPSSKLYYCHPKRQLNENCNHDSQCPLNSYCSSVKSGCLCQNGFAAALVKTGEKETRECLPKFCTDTSACESEYHYCDDNKCKCLPTHFDPTTARCYKFGSTGGVSDENENKLGNLTDASSGREPNGGIYSIIQDLMENRDKMWLVLTILVILPILLLVLIFSLVRRHYLGFCWTAHKQEWDPNDKDAPRNGFVDKDSINNKSFRRKKNLDAEQDDEENFAENQSILVMDQSDKRKSPQAGIKNGSGLKSAKDNRNDYQIINFNTDNQSGKNKDRIAGNNQAVYLHQFKGRVTSTTSTPV